MLIIKGVTLQQQDEMENIILDPDRVFNIFSDEDWVDSDFSRRVITDVDGVDVMDPGIPVREILQANDIPLNKIATGTKNVLLCRFYDPDDGIPVYNRLGRMGENCFKWLMRASLVRDIRMTTTIFRWFHDEDMQGGTVLFEDTGRIAKTGDDVCDGFIDLRLRGLLEIH